MPNKLRYIFNKFFHVNRWIIKKVMIRYNSINTVLQETILGKSPKKYNRTIFDIYHGSSITINDDFLCIVVIALIHCIEISNVV